MLLTGLVASLPRLPLLLRLPISVWELDCDIPSKKGLEGKKAVQSRGNSTEGLANSKGRGERERNWEQFSLKRSSTVKWQLPPQEIYGTVCSL